MNIFEIESKQDYVRACRVYRFVSLYNGARGTWCTSREEAVKEGEAHEKLIQLKLNPEDYISKEDVRFYLDKCIDVWREKRDKKEEYYPTSVPVCYVDAFQSVRYSLLGELKPKEEE